MLGEREPSASRRGGIDGVGAARRRRARTPRRSPRASRARRPARRAIASRTCRAARRRSSRVAKSAGRAARPPPRRARRRRRQRQRAGAGSRRHSLAVTVAVPCPRATRSTARPVGCRCSSASASPPSRRIRARGRRASPSGSTAALLESVEAHRQEPRASGSRAASSLRSHLRMTRRWTVRPRGADGARHARGSCCAASAPKASSGTGRCSSCTRGRSRALGPDILERPPRFDAMLERLRAPTARAGSARRCSTSRSSRGSGTCGSPKRSGTAQLSPWRRLARRRGRRRAARARNGRRADARVGRRRARGAPPGLSPRRAAVPALSDADPRRGGRATPTG